MIDKDLNNELRKKYNPDGSPLRTAQMRMLDILIYIDKICQENDIKYWLDAGTLLGAVRHGGFIPWDDDVDIAMPIEEYNRFKKIIRSEKNEQFIFQDHSTDNHFFNHWGIVRDLKSEYLNDSVGHNILKYKGLQVDIFTYSKNVNYSIAKLSYYYSAIRSKILNFNCGKLSLLIAHFLYHVEQYVYIPIQKLLSCMHTTDGYSYSYGIPFINREHPKEDIYPLKSISFENRIFPAPNNYDAFLKRFYGDYNQLPDENSRGGHNVKFIIKK